MKILVVTLVGVGLISGGLFYLAPGLVVKWAILVMRWRAAVARKEAMVDGHPWAYLDGGVGETILFVHGFGMDKDRWGPFLRGFKGHYRVVVPDLPGFGETPPISSGEYDIPSQVKRLHRFVERTALKTFHLVGISMGGYISAYYAGEYPERVKSLGLMAAAGVESRIPSRAWTVYRRSGQIVLLYRTVEAFMALMSLVFYRPPMIPSPIRRYFAGRGAARYPLHERILQDMERGGMALLEGRLFKVEAETIVIWGAQDGIVHVSSVEKFMGGLKKGRAVVFDKCGHVPYFERPEETMKAYKTFLAGLP